MPQTRQAGRALESLSLGVESGLAVLEDAKGAVDSEVRGAGVLPEGNNAVDSEVRGAGVLSEDNNAVDSEVRGAGVLPEGNNAVDSEVWGQEYYPEVIRVPLTRESGGPWALASSRR